MPRGFQPCAEGSGRGSDYRSAGSRSEPISSRLRRRATPLHMATAGSTLSISHVHLQLPTVTSDLDA
ncbi:hypothetical protein QQF64_011639 [Cirrhinus molitorella]|uniref:Uncharacterized protein n=1 Tax=Cirrhinus molitorella TaxID=172907 RepID=A0ABR3LZV1_9TELE